MTPPAEDNLALKLHEPPVIQPPMGNVEALRRNVDPTFQTFQRWEFEPGADLPWLEEQTKFAKWGHSITKSLWLSRWRILLPLMRRKGVQEIVFFGHERIDVESTDGIFHTTLNFDPDGPLPQGWDPSWHRPTPEDLAAGLNIIQREIMGREVWTRGRESLDVVIEGQLEDGSRLEALMPPCSTSSQVVINIRRFAPVKLRRNDFVGLESLSERAADVLELAMKSRATLLIAAGTGCGKTTLMEYLLSEIPKEEFLITIEDTPELQVEHPRHRGLRTREKMQGLDSNSVFQEVGPADLLRASLRLRPEWIVVGEIRDSGVIKSVADAFVNACQSGHAGGATIHAETPYMSLTRLESMLRTARPNTKDEALRLTIGDTVRLAVVLERVRVSSFGADGVPRSKTLRRVVEIAECLGSDGHNYHLNTIFATRYEDRDFSTAEGLKTVQWPRLEMVSLPFFMLEREERGLPLPDWFYEAKLEFMQTIPKVGIVAHKERLLRF